MESITQPSEVKSETLYIAEIRADGGTQPRAKLSDEVVEEYRQALQDGKSLPPVTVFYDGEHYWLVDGFHRRSAHLRQGSIAIECFVYQGTLQNAQWFSFGANKAHDTNGLRRTNEDKQRAVKAALAHPLADGKSNVLIAEHCGVSEFMVRQHSTGEAATSIKSKSVTRTGRDGRTTNTANIGKGKKKSPPKKSVPAKSTTTQEDLPAEPETELTDRKAELVQFISGFSEWDSLPEDELERISNIIRRHME